MPITHTKVSAIPDGPDATLIRPSDWNADHTGGTLEDVLTEGNDGGNLEVHNIDRIVSDEGAGGLGQFTMQSISADDTHIANMYAYATNEDGGLAGFGTNDGATLSISDSGLTVAIVAGGPTDTGAAGEALMSDGAGKVVWEPPLSTTALLDQGVNFWYRDAILATDPVGYWRLGEPSGTNAVDEMGTGDGTYVNTPTLAAAGLLTGDLNTAVTLNGTNESVTLPGADISGAFSLGLWVNVTPDATYRTALTFRNVTDGSGVQLLSQNTTAGLQRSNWGDGATNCLGAALSAAPHFLVGTYDGTNLRYYLDGALAAGPTVSAQVLTAATSGIVGNGDAFLAGKVDEPAVWDRALSAAEIAALYTVGTTGPSTPTLEDVLTAGSDGGNLTAYNLAGFTNDEGAGGTGQFAAQALSADDAQQAYLSVTATNEDGALIGFGTNQGTSLSIAGVALTADIDSDTGAAGQALVSDGAGKVVWGAPTLEAVLTEGNDGANLGIVRLGGILGADAAAGEGARLFVNNADADDPGALTAFGGSAEAGIAGGHLEFRGGYGDDLAQAPAIFRVEGGLAASPGRILITSDGAAGAAGEALVSDGAGKVVWGSPYPSTTELLDQGVRFWYRQAVLATVPISYWRLGEPSGTDAADEMGAYDGTYINIPTLGVAALLIGDLDTAVTFTRASSEHADTAAPVTTVVDNWTIAAWVKPTASATTRNILYNGSGGDGYGLFLTTANKLWGYAEGAGNLTNGTASSVLSTSVPSFAVLVRRSGTTYIYLNGVLDDTGGTTAPVTPTSMTSIGSENGAAHYFDGTIDEPVIWDRALTADEITELYRIGSGT